MKKKKPPKSRSPPSPPKSGPSSPAKSGPSSPSNPNQTDASASPESSPPSPESSLKPSITTNPASFEIPTPASDAQTNPGLVAQQAIEESLHSSEAMAVKNVESVIAATADPAQSLPPVPVQTSNKPQKDLLVGQQEETVQVKLGGTNAPVADKWVSSVKGTQKLLQKRDEGFVLPSGEACVKIPNSVIERNKKSWECFVMGQFYIEPPSQGTIHNIVNGIWSRNYRDIVVSKMEGNAFLFRIPNAAVRNRVLTQRLWQIEGQTMFVAKWEPGVIPEKPELTSAPIWLELRNVPFQFYNDESLERIASLVGDPKVLHPSTANKTNLEVAKVFTLIDPRKPLPEAVNVQFDSGDICRILVSSPWMPPVCSFCKEIGHSLKRCKVAPTTCHPCKSTTHDPENCPKKQSAGTGKKTRRGRGRSKSIPRKNLPPIYRALEKPVDTPQYRKLNESNEVLIGESSKSVGTQHQDLSKKSDSKNQNQENPPITSSGVEEDSSDVVSTDSEMEEGQISEKEEWQEPKYRQRQRKKKEHRGEGPKHHF